MAQWWERSPPTDVARVQLPASTPYVGWVCCWFSPLLPEVFVRVLRFSPLLKDQQFQIPIRSGTHGHVWISSYELLGASWVNKQFTILLYFFKGCPIRTRRWCFFHRRQTVSYPQESGSHLALTSRCSSILAIGGFYHTVVNTSVDV